MTRDDFAALTVLIVEDQAVEAESLARLLRAIGIGQAIQVENGTAALEMMERLGSDGLDLVISDVEMPDMDGYELARRIRYGAVSRFKDVPIIILTGYYTDENARHARTHKIDGVVVKPLNGEIMLQKLQEVLGAPTS
jgi:CheY-like chemotaxis protein